MPPELFDFLDTQRVGMIAVEMPDGSPHGAAVHFAYMQEPFSFVFLTSPKYRKSEPLHAKDTVRATLVIGFEEGAAEKTFQADGYATLLKGNSVLQECYAQKFPDKITKFADNIFFTFTPTWWRFTDYTIPEGKKTWTS